MRILFAEDDRQLSAVIAESLQKEGYLTDCCYDGEEALAYALHSTYDYDIVLLDRMLPIVDGLTILKAIRQKHIAVPVMLLTGLGGLEDKIDGLDCGADDYLVKPFHIKELLARIRALTRRPPSLTDNQILTAYDLTLERERRRLSCGGRFVNLTQKETDLIAVFMEKPDKTHSRGELIWRVWGENTEIEDGNVDNYIHFLRKRLRELKCRAEIKTIYGAGFCFREWE